MKERGVELSLSEYLFVNNPRDNEQMSTQSTGNTCYFQTYLFVLLFRICDPML